MTYVPIAKGTLNWDVPLNTALTQLDTNTASVLASSLQAANNLSDLTNVSVARANLGISSGSVAGVNQYNVKDYGALGNGVADDTTSIQNAINAATNGGVIFFPPGNYLLNSSQLTVSVTGTFLKGAASESTKLTIGTSFTGTYGIQFTANSCGVSDLSFYGNNTTTTSNPIMNMIECTNVRRSKIMNCLFWYINGWAVEAVAGSTSTNNVDGTMITNNIVRSCAGGFHFLGNTASGYAANSFILNNELITNGVTSGANANLDGIRIEDSWDLLVENNLNWVSVGTGACLRIHGNCAASFIKNHDGLGPNTGNCILIEDGTNGSPQNVQLNGGVIQQGLIGLNITGGATQVRVTSMRFINNQTHGAAVTGTGAVIHFTDCFWSQSGQAATGTNYDINWSGSSNGSISTCRFDSPVVTTGTAGVQETINFPASAPVRVLNCAFGGTSSTSANWFTNTPLGVLEATAGSFNFYTTTNFPNTGTSITTKGNTALQTASLSNTAISGNLGGTSTFDTFRMTADGTWNVGSGSAARDTTWGRTAANTFGLTTTDFSIATAGRGIKLTEGSNAKMGITAAMTAGTITVSTTAVTANSRIFLCAQNTGGTPGALRVSTITAGTSFVITSTSSTDTSTVAWLIIDHN